MKLKIVALLVFTGLLQVEVSAGGKFSNPTAEASKNDVRESNCPICFETVYNAIQLHATTSEAKHELCPTCLKEMIENKFNDRREIDYKALQCPICRNQIDEDCIDNIISDMEDPEITLRLLCNISNFNLEKAELMCDAAEKACNSPNMNILNLGIELFHTIVKQYPTLFRQKAIIAAQTGLQSNNADIKIESLFLLTTLVKNQQKSLYKRKENQEIDALYELAAVAAANNTKKEERGEGKLCTIVDAGFHLFLALVEKEYKASYERATAAAVQIISSIVADRVAGAETPIKGGKLHLACRLLRILIDQQFQGSYAIVTALTHTMILQGETDLGVELLQALIKQGYQNSYYAALFAADTLMQEERPHVRRSGLELYHNLLFKKVKLSPTFIEKAVDEERARGTNGDIVQKLSTKLKLNQIYQLMRRIW